MVASSVLVRGSWLICVVRVVWLAGSIFLDFVVGGLSLFFRVCVSHGCVFVSSVRLSGSVRVSWLVFGVRGGIRVGLGVANLSRGVGIGRL